ncbi:MAG TPA: hypothetical protein VGW10_08265 [Solirubrobacteraceae bacterium]|nr:hypothetical protein [Solirubrobacteraceae bacterium]
MRRLVLATATVTLALALPAPAGAATTRSCGFVGFEPNSDNGAFQIRARGVSCRTARSVARASAPYGPQGDDGRVVRYRARRFACVGRERDSGLASVRFRCTRAAAVITFVRS